MKRFWAKQWRSADLGCLYMHTSAACPFLVPFRDTLLPLWNRNLKWQGKRLLFFSFVQVQCLRQNSKHLFLIFVASKLLHRNLQSLFTELIRNAISESQNICIIANSNYLVDLKLKRKIHWDSCSYKTIGVKHVGCSLL